MDELGNDDFSYDEAGSEALAPVLHRELHKLQEEAKAAKTDMLRYKRLFVEKSEECKTLEEGTKNLEERVRKLLSCREELIQMNEGERSRLEATISSLEDRNSDLTRDAELCDTKLKEMSACLEDKDDELRRLKRDAELREENLMTTQFQSKELLASMKASKAELNNQWEQTLQAVEEKQAKLEKEKKSLQLQLEKVVADSQAYVTKTQEKFQEKLKLSSSFEQTLKHEQVKLHSASVTIAQLEKDMLAKSDELRLEKGLRDKLDSRVQELELELSELRESIQLSDTTLHSDKAMEFASIEQEIEPLIDKHLETINAAEPPIKKALEAERARCTKARKELRACKAQLRDAQKVVWKNSQAFKALDMKLNTTLSLAQASTTNG